MKPVPLEVGSTISQIELPVSPDKAREMALALGADEWRDLALGDLRGRSVVPTFTVTSGFWQDRRTMLTRDLGIPLGRLLHGGQTWEYDRLPRVGEVLHGRTVLDSVREKSGRRGGTMRFVTLASDYTDVDGEPVLRESMILIELAQQPAPAGADAAAREESGGRDDTSSTVPAPDGGWSMSRPVTRTDIVRYAGASGDFNPIHHDEAFARAEGLPGVFAMGMLQAGILGVEVAQRLDGRRLRRFDVRFTDRVWPDELLTFQSEAPEAEEDGGRRFELRVLGGDGRQVVSGTASADNPTRAN